MILYLNEMICCTLNRHCLLLPLNEEENVLDYSSNDENDDNDVIVEDPREEKFEQEKAIWKTAG